MGWVALALLGIVVMWVLAWTMSPAGWGIENRRIRRTQVTFQEYGEQLRPAARYNASLDPPDYAKKRIIADVETPSPLDPLRDSLTSLVLAAPHAVMRSESYLAEWRFANFAKLVVLGAYLGFVLPMFTLAYASGAIGGERETRTLIWLLTRPMPRGAIYLAKFLGALPWCLAFSLGGFLVLCSVGGDPGPRHHAGPLRPLPSVRVVVSMARGDRARVRLLLRDSGRGAAGKPEAALSHLLRA